jgi:hypothetical protein
MAEEAAGRVLESRPKGIGPAWGMAVLLLALSCLCWGVTLIEDADVDRYDWVFYLFAGLTAVSCVVAFTTALRMRRRHLVIDYGKKTMTFRHFPLGPSMWPSLVVSHCECHFTDVTGAYVMTKYRQPKTLTILTRHGVVTVYDDMSGFGEIIEALHDVAPPLSHPPPSRQAYLKLAIVVLLIVLAFGTAVLAVFMDWV